MKLIGKFMSYPKCQSQDFLVLMFHLLHWPNQLKRVIVRSFIFVGTYLTISSLPGFLSTKYARIFSALPLEEAVERYFKHHRTIHLVIGERIARPDKVLFMKYEDIKLQNSWVILSTTRKS